MVRTMTPVIGIDFVLTATEAATLEVAFNDVSLYFSKTNFQEKNYIYGI